MAKKPIVAINCKAEILGAYDSLVECADLNGFPRGSVHNAYRYGYTYKGTKFISQDVHRKHWEEGTLDELCYNTKKERMAEKTRKIVKAREAVKDEWKRKLSEAHKKRVQEGISHCFKASASFRKPIVCINDSKVYESIKATARSLGVSPNAIMGSLKKGHKIKGLKFQYYDL